MKRMKQISYLKRNSTSTEPLLRSYIPGLEDRLQHIDILNAAGTLLSILHIGLIRLRSVKYR